jgi:hypothetical protein
VGIKFHKVLNIGAVALVCFTDNNFAQSEKLFGHYEISLTVAEKGRIIGSDAFKPNLNDAVFICVTAPAANAK